MGRCRSMAATAQMHPRAASASRPRNALLANSNSNNNTATSYPSLASLMVPPVRRKKGLLLGALSVNGGNSANASTGGIGESSKKRSSSDLDGGGLSTLPFQLQHRERVSRHKHQRRLRRRLLHQVRLPLDPQPVLRSRCAPNWPLDGQGVLVPGRHYRALPRMNQELCFSWFAVRGEG